MHLCKLTLFVATNFDLLILAQMRFAPPPPLHHHFLTCFRSLSFSRGKNTTATIFTSVLVAGRSNCRTLSLSLSSNCAYLIPGEMKRLMVNLNDILFFVWIWTICRVNQVSLEATVRRELLSDWMFWLSRRYTQKPKDIHFVGPSHLYTREYSFCWAVLPLYQRKYRNVRNLFFRHSYHESDIIIGKKKNLTFNFYFFI